MPKITIGMPIYNADQFIKNRLEGILSQTFDNFELIISDNASTDSTQLICEDYSMKDKRIRYIRQNINMGSHWNYNFVLHEAQSKYFVWATDDDEWAPDFLEQNIRVLEMNPTFVGSIGKVERCGPPIAEFEESPNDSSITKIYKKLRRKLRIFGVYSTSGSYGKRVRIYLKNPTIPSVYALYRTDKLKKSMIDTPFPAWDLAIILNVLKYGDLHVVEKTLLYFYTGGISSEGIINVVRQQNIPLKQILFPWYSFTKWSVKNLGLKIFCKNLDCFIWLNCTGIIPILVLIFNSFSRNMTNTKK